MMKNLGTESDSSTSYAIDIQMDEAEINRLTNIKDELTSKKTELTNIKEELTSKKEELTSKK